MNVYSTNGWDDVGCGNGSGLDWGNVLYRSDLKRRTRFSWVVLPILHWKLGCKICLLHLEWWFQLENCGLFCCHRKSLCSIIKYRESSPQSPPPQENIRSISWTSEDFFVQKSQIFPDFKGRRGTNGSAQFATAFGCDYCPFQRQEVAGCQFVPSVSCIVKQCFGASDL